jgi:hypothetical protein
MIQQKRKWQNVIIITKRLAKAHKVEFDESVVSAERVLLKSEQGGFSESLCPQTIKYDRMSAVASECLVIPVREVSRRCVAR